MRTAFRNVLRSAFLQLTAVLSAAIRTAATNSWMSGYLGGNFKPDEGVTMRDAIKAVLGVLGYTNEDFSGGGSTAGTVPPSRRKNHTAVHFAM